MVRRRSSKTRLSPDEVDIAKLAYERFEARGSVHGFDQEDWVSAERELKSRV